MLAKSIQCVYKIQSVLYSFCWTKVSKMRRKKTNQVCFNRLSVWFLRFFSFFLTLMLLLFTTFEWGLYYVAFMVVCVCVHLWAFSDKITWLSPFLVSFVCLLTPFLSFLLFFFFYSISFLLYFALWILQYFAFFVSLLLLFIDRNVCHKQTENGAANGIFTYLKGKLCDEFDLFEHVPSQVNIFYELHRNVSMLSMVCVHVHVWDRTDYDSELYLNLTNVGYYSRCVCICIRLMLALMQFSYDFLWHSNNFNTEFHFDDSR